MDIAKIRKKLKETEKQKPLEESQGEKSESTRPEVENAQKTADTKTEIIQDKVETPQEVTQPEKSPDIVTEIDIVPEKEIEILAFMVADEEYGVKTTEVQEILRYYTKTTHVPRSPKYLKGVTSIRGKILPVIDLKERLRLKNENRGRQKIIILKTSKEPIGVLVGSVLDVIRFPKTELLQPPPTLNDEESGFIEGVVRIRNRFISVLNVNKIVEMETL